MTTTLSPSAPADTESLASGHLSRSPGRVAHLTSVHSVFDVRIFQKECRSLAKAGYEVVLIAPHHQSETVDGVRIEPVRGNASRRRRMTTTALDVWRKAMETRADLYHFHDPELLPVGVLLKAAGKRVIYDAHENVAKDILNKPWMAASSRQAVSKGTAALEWLSCKTFDAIIAATPAIANLFPANKTVLVQNYPRSEEFLTKTSVPFSERRNTVLYLGGIEGLKGAREMVAAMAKVPERLAAKLLLLGNLEGPELASDLARSPGWQHTQHLGFQGRPEVARIASHAKVGLVLFHPAPNYDDSQPNKLFEYMSAGLPVIASNFPHWKELIERIDGGLTVDPLDPAAIARAITWVLENPAKAEAMGKRCQAAVRSTYNWATQEQSLLRIYERILQ